MLVAKKWDYSSKGKSVGRPRIRQVIVDLILRLARENPTWGYDRIQGALANLGYHISDQTVGNILKEHGIELAPERKRQTSWKTFLKAPGVLAAIDSTTIEAMKTLAAGRQQPLEPLNRAITYLGNNASRMRYNQYRCRGLPITTSLVESTQTQVNHRVKGTKKLWRDENLEPLLQLVADDLSDTHDHEGFWERRRRRFNGFRKRRVKT
jgi:hypothetical protein